MDKFLAVIKVVLPVTVALLLGFITRQKKVISKSGVESIKKFVLTFPLPIMIFYGCYKAEIKADVLVVILLLAAFQLLAVVFARLLTKWILYPYSILAYFISGVEVSMFGFVLYTSLFGDAYISYVAFMNVGVLLAGNIFWMPSLIMRRERLSGGGEKVSKKHLFWSAIKNPIFLGFFFGFLCSITGLTKVIEASSAGGILDALLSFIGAPASMTILFVVGYGIQFSKKNMGAVIKSSLLRFINTLVFGVLLIVLLNVILSVDFHMNWALILTYTLPASFVLPLFAVGKEETEYVSTCVSFYTLISLFAFVIIACIVV